MNSWTPPPISEFAMVLVEHGAHSGDMREARHKATLALMAAGYRAREIEPHIDAAIFAARSFARVYMRPYVAEVVR
jgi:hypothetical protein